MPKPRMVTVKINVTETDIKEGIARHCEKCPVGRAITRRLKRPYIASVSGLVILIVNSDSGAYVESHPVPAPDSVNKFVRDFDCSRDTSAAYTQWPDPMSFEIELPQRYLRHA